MTIEIKAKADEIAEFFRGLTVYQAGISLTSDSITMGRKIDADRINSGTGIIPDGIEVRYQPC